VFGIFPKILEVNWTMTPVQQGRMFEVHPEVSFWA
jgi:predicted RNase H-like nuclease